VNERYYRIPPTIEVFARMLFQGHEMARNFLYFRGVGDYSMKMRARKSE
jgi:hypothetical protein